MLHLRNIKIATQLKFAFGLLVLMIVLVGMVGIVKVSQVSSQVTLTTQDRVPKTVMVYEIKSELNIIARALRNIIIFDNEKQTREETERIAKSRGQIVDHLKKLTEMITTPKGVDLLNQVKAQREIYIPLQDKFLNLAKEGKGTEAKAVLLDELRPAQNKYFAALDGLLKYQEELMKETEVATAQSVSDTKLDTVAAVVVASLFAVLFSAAIIKAITQPVGQAVAVARSVAQGDLTTPIHVDGQNETAMLLQALKDMQDHLTSVVANVLVNADAVSTSSSEIAKADQDLSARTESQASSLEETAASMEQLSSTVQQNADNAKQANQLALEASNVALKGGQVVSQVVDTMRGISASSKQIAEIINVIDGIAFQTNILALNAAVEAARAGEQGRGFAVVAGEVRSLAGRSAEAAKEIKSLISDSVHRVESGTALVDDAGSTMEQVVTSIRRVTDIMGEISSASQEQSSGVRQVGEAVNNMDQVTQQNAALVEEMAAAASSLSHQAKEMVKAVSVFNIGQGDPLKSLPSLSAPRDVTPKTFTPKPVRLTTQLKSPAKASAVKVSAPAPAIAATPVAKAPKPSAPPAPQPAAEEWETF